MSEIYPFLFFLQNHALYFRNQDSVLGILSRNPENDFGKISRELISLDPEFLLEIQNGKYKSCNPFKEDKGIHRVRYGEGIYPCDFKYLIDPPLVFSYMGSPIWFAEKISVVGSRDPSQKSIWWMSQELKRILSSSALVSVSGGAIGVDQIAHQTSIELNLPTIAILPSGLKCLYPQRFSRYVESIIKNKGCILSEFQDDQNVFKHHFSFRNRLIAALGKVSVIVEAREKSGTLITAHRALEMGKDVFVVPGHPLDDNFKGSLSLLKLGAHILTEAQDIDYWL